MAALAEGNEPWLDGRVGYAEHDGPENAEQWNAQRRVRAELISDALRAQPHDKAARPFTFIGLRIVGELMLSGARVASSLRFQGCVFDDALWLDGLTGPEVAVANSIGSRVSAQLAHVAGTMSLAGSQFELVDLAGCDVGAQLNCRGIRAGGAGRAALRLVGAKIGADVILTDAILDGEAQLRGVHVGGDLWFNRARLRVADGVALNAAHLAVDRDVSGYDATVDGDLTMADVRVRGRLDLSASRVRGTTELTGGAVGELVLAEAELHAPDHDALVADRMVIARALFAHGRLVARGRIRLVDTRVEGPVHFDNALVEYPAGPAVIADRLSCTSLYFVGARVQGGIAASAARVRGQLALADARISHHGVALYAEVLHVDQGLYAAGLRTVGDVALPGATVSGACVLLEATIDGVLQLRGARFTELVLNGARIAGRGERALNAESIHVDQSLLAIGATFGGSIHLPMADVGGVVNLDTATIGSQNGLSLRAERLQVGGNVILRSVHVQGVLQMLGAAIRGQFIATDLTLDGSPRAMLADGLEVGADMVISDSRAAGEIRLIGARIGGQLTLRRLATRGADAQIQAESIAVIEDAVVDLDAHGPVGFKNARFAAALTVRGRFVPQSGRALILGGVGVSQQCTINDFYAEGTVDLDRARFSGGLMVSNARILGSITALGSGARDVVLDDTVVRVALGSAGGGDLNCFAMNVEQAFVATGSVTTDGEINLSRATVGAQLMLVNCRIAERGGGIRLSDATVKGLAVIAPRMQAGGRVDLRRLDTLVLDHPEDSWPDVIHLDGARYQRLEGDTRFETCQRWLRRAGDTYRPQPYEELASFFRRSGRPESARRVSVAQQQHRRQQLSWRGKLLNRFLEWTVGYGYRPWFAAVWLAAALALAWAVFDAEHPEDIRAARSADRMPDFDARSFAVDVTVPVINLHHRDAWAVSGSAQDWVLFFTIAGWVLSTALVAGLTGVLRRE